MEHATIIGIDLAKRRLQLHGARADVGCVPNQEFLNRDKVWASWRRSREQAWPMDSLCELDTVAHRQFEKLGPG